MNNANKRMIEMFKQHKTSKPRVKFYNNGMFTWFNSPILSDYEVFGWLWWSGSMNEDGYKEWCKL